MNVRLLVCAMLLGPVMPGGAGGAAPGDARPRRIVVADGARAELERGVAELGREIEALRGWSPARADLAELLPDVQIFHKAVQFALGLDEFYRTNDVALARDLLAQGRARARQLTAGQPAWVAATGLVVRGYISRIDGSVQPYGLVVPPTWQPGPGRQPQPSRRLDVWLHGRDDQLTELKFLQERQHSPGPFNPPDAFVLHPYGRFCNAFKFAGEVDVFEAMQAVAKNYPIDERRVGLRGFSMGGAGCWHLAVHHADRWRAAAPGAGFAETAEYTGALERQPGPAPFEQKLWHLYDATDYAVNLFNCPTIAYSGELDKQRQAAEVMARALRVEGLDLVHLIGPGVQHAYEPRTKQLLAERFDEVMSRERDRGRWPQRVRWTSWTLRYNRMEWVTVDRLEKHWDRARVDAERSDASTIRLDTTNVAALHLQFDDAAGAAATSGPVHLVLDGRRFDYGGWAEARGAFAHGYEKLNGGWARRAARADAYPPPKQHGLQGPIDDAFMDSFLFVRPTGRPLGPMVGARIQEELERASRDWRAQFRGDVLVKSDTAVTDEDIRRSHLVLWGDPQSNRVLSRILSQLPLRWDAREVRLGGGTFEATNHVPVLIYPNPLNPARYVVLNSGFTFSEFQHSSNALQTPKLPDFAVLALPGASAPGAGSRLNGGVVHAGFFGENWEALR